MSKHEKQKAFDKELLTTYRHFTASPDKALAAVNCATRWEQDKKFAVTKLHASVFEELALSLFAQYVKKWEKFQLEKPVVIIRKDSAKWEKKNPNRWLGQRIKMIRRATTKFPVATSRLRNDSLRKQEAQLWSLKCIEAGKTGAQDGLTVAGVVAEVQLLADQWGFVPKVPTQIIEQLNGESPEDYAFREEEELSWFHLSRLLDEKWWARKIETAYRQFCEHCQIIAGRVRKGASQYLSNTGLGEYRTRRDAGIMALSRMVARNEESGEEIDMLDIVKSSMANPAIRRHELMVRMRGFEDLAQEFGLMGGFFTLTAPSRFHAFTKTKNKKWSFDNSKYQGFNPKQAQEYLSKVWTRARAKLKRMGVPIFGFRVCEPHHDGTPHWHALFFFNPEHEQAIRFVLADYFTKAEREELHVNNDDFKSWGKAIKNGLTSQDLEFSFAENKQRDHIYSVSKRIGARFDYKKIDPEKGSATGYIAKYIAKNIDGYKMPDDEDTGKPADKTAEAVLGWASTWCIRQFQQIGGAPVSVWRQLRRLDQTDDEKADKQIEIAARAAAKEKGEKYVSTKQIQSFYDLQKNNDSIEVARIAANSSNWSMYVHAMGGLFALRAEHPIKMVYKDASSKYGEVVKKLTGLANDERAVETQTEGWVITQKSAPSAGVKKELQLPWSSVNNCTVPENEAEKQEVSNLLRERGEHVTDRLVTALLTFQPVVLDERIVNDIKHVTRAHLKPNLLNIGGNFRILVWDDKTKHRYVDVEVPEARFKDEGNGFRNLIFGEMNENYL
jgi:hypothetical protein